MSSAASKPVNALGWRFAFGTGHAQKRPHQPAAIHAVQRELIDRNDTPKSNANRQEAEEREEIFWQRRAYRMRLLVEETEVVEERDEQTIGVRDEYDEQDRRQRCGYPQGDRAGEAPFPHLRRQGRDQPIGGAT
jgi:hypothetical protein